MKYIILIITFFFTSNTYAKNINISVKSDLVLNCKFEKVIIKNLEHNFVSFKKDGDKKSKFNDKKKSFGFTNNPKYFGKKSDEVVEKDDKRSSFKGRKKFKKRQRPKKFSFKKHKKK